VGKRIVYVIDDDVAVRDSFHVLLEANDLDVRSYASSETFLNDTPPLQNSCLVIDVNMPDLDGLICFPGCAGITSRARLS